MLRGLSGLARRSIRGARLSSMEAQGTSSQDDQIRHNVAKVPALTDEGHGLLRHEPPYWITFTTHAKMRWFGRRILDILVEEFRDRTKHYYTWAIHKGYLTINGKRVLPTYVVENGDVITHTTHKHEPPITSDPVRILHRDDSSGRLVVVKPGSVPVHPAGRYNRHSLLELIKSDYGIDKVFTANRLDRLTSGIMVASTSTEAAKQLGRDFDSGRVRKAYVCRVAGKFPGEETVCTAPLLSLDRQTGVVITHPTGREAKTMFNRLSYDQHSDTSVLYCRPVTGRTHQIRVHAQLLGHPIPNDPIYNDPIWKVHPASSFADIPAPSNSVSDRDTIPQREASMMNYAQTREIATSAKGAALIAALKDAKDEDEDWGRFRDEQRFAKWNQDNGWLESDSVEGIVNSEAAQNGARHNETSTEDSAGDLGYCKECHVPLLPDPEPDKLFIYLHAIRYETTQWSYEDELPWWALDDWQSPDAQKRHAQRRAEGRSLRPPTLQLVSEAEAGAAERKLTTEDTAVGAQAEVEERASMAVVPRDRAFPFLLEQSKPQKDVLQVEQDGESDPLLQPLVLEVFRGLEDFLAHDLQIRLGERCSSSSLETALHSAYLILAPQVGQRILKTALPFVSARHLLVARARMPDELLAQLNEDRRLLGTCRPRNKTSKIKKKLARGGRKSREEAAQEARDQQRATEASAPVERAQDGVTIASEARLQGLIESVWESSLNDIRSGIERWKAETLPPERWSWRARVHRSAYHFPTLITTELERFLGGIAWRLINGDTDETEGDKVPHPVSLTAPDLEVELQFVPGIGAEVQQPPEEPSSSYASSWESNPPGSLMLMLKLPEGAEYRGSTASLAYRPDIADMLTEGGTTLARHRAYTLSALLPIQRTQGTELGPLKIWEPCVGSGAIAIEIAQALLERGGTDSCDAIVFGSDVERGDLEKANIITQRSGWADGVKRNGVTIHYRHFDLRDAAEAPQERSATSEGDAMEPYCGPWFDEGELDGIITDLPWGHRVLGHSVLSNLYLRFLQACARNLKPGHYAVAMTSERKTFHRALREAESLARRRADGWMMKIEHLSLDGDSMVEAQGRKQADELEGTRVVEMALRPNVFLLKKVPLPL